MEPKLIFASHNKNKTREIGAMLSGLMQVVSLDDIGFSEEIIESGSTLHENAFIKASCIYNHSLLNCFADDTGLLVDALDGAPGVYSARYAGPEKDAIANNQKLLEALKGNSNRLARFETVICLFLNGKAHYFEGVLEGEITEEPIGQGGFGYDPVFKPLGSNLTLAQISLDEKNAFSHRARAFHKMVEFLKTIA